MNPDIPIFIGSGNEATVSLTEEIADGWLPLGYMPGTMDKFKPWLEKGFKRVGNGRGDTSSISKLASLSMWTRT
ncbi:MAG: hypothetical protein ACPGQV_00670 [Alphaproteobacteria bacterium]